MILDSAVGLGSVLVPTHLLRIRIQSFGEGSFLTDFTESSYCFQRRGLSWWAMRKCIAYLISGLCAGALCVAASELQQASVTMPYAELAGLLDRVSAVERTLEDAPPKPPVAVVVHSAEYTLKCDEIESPELAASFSLSNLSETWQMVPLLPASAVLVSVEPMDTKWVPKDGRLCLLLEPMMEASVHVGLLVGGDDASGSRRTVAEFYAVAAAKSRLTIQYSGDPAELIVSGAVGSNAGKTVYGLPSAGGSVRVSVYESQALQPTVWKGAAEYLALDGGGSIEVQCRLRLTASDNGRTSAATLRLPPAAELKALCSAGLRGPYEIEISATGSVVHLRWPDDRRLGREVQLTYRLPLLNTDELWEVSGLSVLNVGHWDATYYMLPFESYALQPDGLPWETVERVPSWMAECVGAKTLWTAEAQDTQGLRVVAKALPRLKTSEATVPIAQYWTEVVSGGGMLHKAQVTIEHRSQTRYRFTLPDGGKLLSCAVNHRAVEPLIDGEHGLALVLPKVATKEAKTTVTYVYTTKGSKLDPVEFTIQTLDKMVEGQALLELPRTPLFIYEVKWQVQLPDDYQATALEGNVVIESGGANNKPICLSKQIFDEEAPRAALYYTRKDLE